MGLFDRFFGPPSKDQFARMLQDAIQKAGEKDPIRYDAEAFCLHAKGEGENTLHLTNAYHEYCGAAKSQRQTVVRNFVQTWFSSRKEMPDDFESARPDLRPGVRNRMLFEHTAMTLKAAGKSGMNWPYQVLGEFLGVGLIYDLPSTMMQLQQHHLDQWQTDFDTAFEVACDNLREVTTQTLHPVAPGVWVSPWRDNYDPARMLLTDYIRRHPVTGDPVAMVPNRDTFLLTGSQDSAGLAKLVETAEAAYEHSRPLSGMAFRLTAADEWVPFLPAPGRPGCQKFQLLRVKSIGSDYADQKATLDELHRNTDRDIFVASYSAVAMQGTGEIRSYCVWSAGVVAFLPKTDYIYFFRPRDNENGDIVATVPWDKAAAVLGDRIKPVGIYPERYLVEGFPSEAEITAWGFQ